MIQKFIITFMLFLYSAMAFTATADVNNPQGAVWNLREAGFNAEAQDLENQLIEILKNSEITAVAPFSVRTSKSYLVRFPGNIFAVMKEDDPDVKVSHRFDVASFVADRLIELNMVPITIAREIQGKNYSLQLYYPVYQDAKTVRTETEFATPRYWDLIAFDDLIANKDREIQNLHNVIIGIDGRLVAIDHARTFRLDRYARIQNGVYLDKTSTKFKEGFSKAKSQDLAQAFQGLLNKEQLTEFSNKQAEMSREIRVRSQFGSASAPKNKPETPRDFTTPLELQEKIFVDLFALKVLLGPDSRAHSQLDINKLIESHPDQEFVRTQALQNWEYFSPETRARILPQFFGVKDFAISNRSFLQKALQLNPEFVFPMMAHESFRLASFPHIAKALAVGKTELTMTVEIRQLLREHLVQGQLKNRAGFDFDELFPLADEQLKRTFLRELYQDMIKAGLQDHVAKIFRLIQLKNATLPARIIGAFPLKTRPLIQAQLIQSYKQMMPAEPRDLQSDPVKMLSRLIGNMRRIPLSTPMCEGLF
jgi:hypothetical protein